jgi:hypothetical protein
VVLTYCHSRGSQVSEAAEADKPGLLLGSSPNRHATVGCASRCVPTHGMRCWGARPNTNAMVRNDWPWAKLTISRSSARMWLVELRWQNNIITHQGVMCCTWS